MTKRKWWKQEMEAEERAELLGEDLGWTEEFSARRERESRRLVNTAMRFWVACPRKICRRHRRCSHDPDFCGPIFWSFVPEPMKAWWRALHEAKAQGHSPARALREAGEAEAFEQRRQASYAAVPRTNAEPPSP